MTQDERIAALEAKVAHLRQQQRPSTASDAYYKALFRSMVNFATIGTDTQGRVVEWNHGAERVLGWSANEMLGQNVSRIFTLEDRAAGRDEYEMRHALETGQSDDHRWHLRADGSHFWASGEMTPVWSEAGVHLGYLKVLQDRTPAQLLMQDLAHSQRKYQHILDSIDAAFGVIELKFDAQGRAADYKFLETNKAFERHTGLRRPEGLWMRGLVPEHDQHWFDLYGRVAQTGEAIRLIERADALGRWLDVQATPVPDSNGTQVAVLFYDISTRRNAELALASSEAHWRGLFEGLGDGFILAELIRNEQGEAVDWRCLDINPAAATYLRIPSGGVKGQKILDLFPGMRSTWVDDPAQAVNTRESIAFTRQLFERGRWYQGQIHPVDGDRFAIIGREITETRQADIRRQGLLELSDTLRTLSDPEHIRTITTKIIGQVLSADEAIYAVLAEGGKIVSIAQEHYVAPGLALSDGVVSLLPLEAALGRQLFSYFAEAPNDGIFRFCGLTDKGHLSAMAVPVQRLENGLGVVLAWSARTTAPWPLQDAHFAREAAERAGTALGKQHAETALRTLNTSLEELVDARTEELLMSEEQLRQSQKMEAVGQLTGGIAHDFNNLLTGISGSLEMLQKRLLQGRVHDLDKYVHAALGSSKRAAALTHRLLAFSRRQTLDPKPTDVNSLIDGMRDLITRTVGPSISVRAARTAALGLIYIDGNQLENALLNLSINARDAMPNGGVLAIEALDMTINEVEGRRYDLPPGEYVSICVTDTGTGMSEETKRRAFEPFYTTKPLGTGTGLGLSMIYGFIKQSAGQIRIRSELGAGTEACLYIPHYEGREVLEQPTEHHGDLPRAIDGETVLVVDDEPAVRVLVMEVLEDLGYKAIEAADGESGLRVLKSNIRIDLLITDVGLPGGMNGRQMADAARDSRPTLEVLFITGFAESAVFGEGNQDAHMHVMTKPFTLEALARKIRILIERAEDVRAPLQIH